MTETLDGSQSLADQESAIQFKEAKGYSLTALAGDESNPPMNNADFDRLDTGRPKRIHVTSPPLPQGKTQVCTGKIYVAGTLTDVIAYRD